MSYSLNEITATCKRAARGAGLSWGLAEDAGFAARWLASHGLPGPEMLAHHLTAIDGTAYDQICPRDTTDIWQTKGAALSPLITGPALCDLAAALARGREITLGCTSYPMLLLPFIAAASALGGVPLIFTWPGLTAGFAAQLRLDLPGGAPLDCSEIPTAQIKAGQSSSGTAIPPKNRGEISPEALHVLGSLGHRTYAPDTAESRLSGAGAGLSDND